LECECVFSFLVVKVVKRPLKREIRTTLAAIFVRGFVCLTRGVAGARSVGGILYNVSGSCSGWLGVCGHCSILVVDISVIVCFLV
jgi:hypothetical protein